jgi:hypothetical protein
MIKIFVVLLVVKFGASQINFNFNSVQKFIYEKSQNYFFNDLCDAQLEYIEENLNQGALWAKIMRDSWGNFPTGTFSGNYYDFGAFDQCIRFTHNSNSLGTFHGQHCTVIFSHRVPTEEKRGRFAPSMRLALKYFNFFRT